MRDRESQSWGHRHRKVAQTRQRRGEQGEGLALALG